MRTDIITGLALCTLLLAAPTTAVADQVSLDQIVVEAQRVRAEAREVSQLLRAKRPDFTLVNQRVDTLHAHARALTQSLESFETDAAGLRPTQAEALDRARTAGALLSVMLSNKTSMLSDVETAGRQRSLLRAKAEGIARRAAIVEAQLARVRG